jgi:hypothetical protein
MMRKLGNGLVLVVILVIAGFVLHTAPTAAERDAPLYVNGAVDERLVGRNIAATVTSVTLADEVTTSRGWTGTTEGVWVVVDASAEAVTDENGALLYAWLVIGDATYSASPRPGLGTLANSALSVGIPASGPIMFEVSREAAASVDAATAHVQFAVSNDPRADSLINVEVDLPGAPTAATLDVDEPVWGKR